MAILLDNPEYAETRPSHLRSRVHVQYCRDLDDGVDEVCALFTAVSLSH